MINLTGIYGLFPKGWEVSPVGMMVAGAKFPAEHPPPDFHPNLEGETSHELSFRTDHGAAIVVLAVIFFIIAAFAGLFGLDFPIAIKVCGYLFLTTLIAVGLFIFTNRSKKIIPATLVCYLYSFYPAYNFWAYGVKNTFQYNYLIGRDAPWYANNWIQFGIAIVILLIGHFYIWAASDEI